MSPDVPTSHTGAPGLETAAAALDWEAGVQAMFLSVPRPDISEERFHYHYRWVHGGLALDTLSRGGGGLMNRYVQSHRIGALDGLTPLAWAALGEAWFDSTEQLQQSYSRGSFLDRVVPDGDLFADEPRTVWFDTRSRIVRRAAVLPQAAARVLLLIHRREDLDEDEAQRRWDERALRAARMPGLLELVQTEVLSEAPVELEGGGLRPATGWTALESLTFADALELDRVWASDGAAFLEDLSTVADVERSAGGMTAVQRVF